jgi:6-phosphofructokinase 2
MKSIITLTLNPAVDQSSTTPIVTNEKKLRCSNVRYDPGGGGINVSRAINRLGGKSKAFYPAGGHIGNLLEELLKREKIDQVRFTIKESTRLNIHVIEETSDKQYRFNMPGTSMKEREWQHILTSLREFIPSPDYIVASGSLPPHVPTDFYREIAVLSKEIGCKLILDTRNEPLKQALHEGVYLIKPNLYEFQQLIGETFQNEAKIIHEAQEIIQSNQCKYIIISLGVAGTFLIKKDNYKHIPSPLVPIKSRVGAGDCMVGGITLMLAKEKSIEEAVRYGISAGASAVMTPGTELCRREDTERIYSSIMDPIIKV